LPNAYCWPGGKFGNTIGNVIVRGQRGIGLPWKVGNLKNYDKLADGKRSF